MITPPFGNVLFTTMAVTDTKLHELAGKRRLRDVQQRGRTGDAALLRHREKVFQNAQFHMNRPFRFFSIIASARLFFKPDTSPHRAGRPGRIHRKFSRNPSQILLL